MHCFVAVERLIFRQFTQHAVSGVTTGWLLRLVTGGPTGGRGPPTVLEFLLINF